MRCWPHTLLLLAGCVQPTPGYGEDETGSATGTGDSSQSSGTDAGGTAVSTDDGSTDADGGGTTGPGVTSAGTGSATGTGDPGTGDTTAGETTAGDTSATGTGGGLDRVTQDILVLYELDETMGSAVPDSSGVPPALDLEIADMPAVSWRPTGLLITGDTILASAGPATKILDGCQSTDEITVEVWLTPEVAAVDPHARIVTMSLDTLNRNFTLAHYDWTLPSMPAHDGAAYFMRLRTDMTGAQGYPNYVAAHSATTNLAHVVHTWKSGTEVMYIDGVEWTDIVQVGDAETIVSAPKLGTFASWDPSYRLALANEMTLDRPFHGELHLVAIYKRALTAAEVLRNFEAGF